MPGGVGLFFRKKQEIHSYDRESQRPVIRASICTGERTAGFRNLQTGKFTEVMLVRSEEDLREFRRLYGLGDGEISTEY